MLSGEGAEMCSHRLALIVSLLIPLSVFSGHTANAQEPVGTTVCAIMRNPAAFAGRIVRVHATVSSGFESSTIVDADDKSCRGPWFEDALRKGEQARDGYDAELQRQHPVFLKEDDNMKRFNDALNAVVYPRERKVILIGGNRYNVTATMTGRLDDSGANRLGFGHMNAYRVRFLLSSVQQISIEERDYNWAEFSREPVQFPHGTIRGKLLDVLGRPIKSATVEAIPAAGEVPISNPEASTEEDGSYSLTVEPGKYFVVVNRTIPASEGVPVLTTYFPETESETGAKTLDIADGVELTDIDIHIRRTLTPRYFDVQVLLPSGNAASGSYTYLTQTNQAPIVGYSVTHTSAEGKARLTGFEGVDYLLWAELGSGPNERCAKALQLATVQSSESPVVMRVELAEPACSKQEDEARSFAYATQKR
jgi:hypothetical protein